MKALLIAAPLTLALAACHPGPQRVAATPTRLNCPATQGDLALTNAAADGRSCEYAAGTTEVSLRLMPVVGGDPGATLGGLERELRQLKPVTASKVIATDGGEHAEVNLPGLHISARDDSANVRVAGFNIDANDNGAAVKRISDVRLKGEALSPTKRGVSALFILAGDQADAAGYGMVGYEARGPRTGPLTVAVVKARDEDGAYDQLHGDISRLIRRNAR